MYENFDDTEWSEDVEVLVTKAMDLDYDEIVDEYYSDGYTEKELASELGLHPSDFI